MTLVGNRGQCAVVPPEMKGWNSARAVAVIRLANATNATNATNANYVRLWLENPSIQFLMHAWSNTTVQETLNLKEIRKLPLLWPSQKVLEVFSRTVAPLFKRVENNNRQSETLATLRDTLLPKLLSGQLSVVEATTFGSVTGR